MVDISKIYTNADLTNKLEIVIVPPCLSQIFTLFPVCECRDLKRNQIWACGEKWTEDCINKTCKGGKIEMTSVTCPNPVRPTMCPRGQMVRVSDGCCDYWKCDCESGCLSVPLCEVLEFVYPCILFLKRVLLPAKSDALFM